MNINIIKKLIESFYNGETSPSEELLLRDYFNSCEVSEELLEEKEIFLQFYDSTVVNVPTTLESKLEDIIDELAYKDSKKKNISIRKIVLWSSVAASIAILASAGIYMNNFSLEGDNTVLTKESQLRNKMQITDAEYMEAENAMRLFSMNFNKGMEQIDEMNNNLEKTSEILNNTFKKK